MSSRKQKTKPGMSAEQMAAEGERLSRLWERYKATSEQAGTKMTQAIFAEKLEGMTPGNFNHLLRGRQPIPLETLFELAILMDFDPREVRPSTQAFIDKVFRSVKGYEISIIGRIFGQLSSEKKENVVEFARYLSERKE